MSLISSFNRTRLFVSPLIRLRPDIAGAVALVAWAAFLWQGEPEPALLFAVVAIHLGASALLAALLGRPRVGLALATFFLLAVFIGAKSKFALVSMNLHVYDLPFYLFAGAPVEFFMSAYPRQALMVGLGLTTTALAFIFLWRADARLRLSPRRRMDYLACAAALLSLGAWPLSGRNADFFNERNFALSSFLTSFADLPQLYSYNGLIEVAPKPSITPIPADAITCKPQGQAPDIVMMLNESSMPPGVYPGLVYPEELTPFFTSFDGRIHPLRVETFGGGTWLSDFSALTGLSTHSFGNLRNFVANFMTGRLRHSLPQYLRACGYETALIYPASAGFAGVGRFYEAIGFDKVIDTSVHKATDQRQRDAFYLGEAAKFLEAPSEGKRKPRFIVVSSMSTHSPWDFRFSPDSIRETESLRWNADPEFDEYLWRLLLAKRDRDDFRERLSRTLPDHRILYVGYGDHQPALAKVPLENNRAIADDGRSWQLDHESKAFETYFTLDAQGFTPRFPGANHPIVEISNLPVITIVAAGLPLDPVFARRERLMARCNGLYATCRDRASVLAFQRWLVDSRWIAQN